MPAADAGDTDGEGAPQGLSWSWELDLGALIDSIDAVLPGAVSSIAPSSDDPSSDGPSSEAPSCGAPGSAEEEAEQEAILDELLAMDQSGGGKRIPMRALAGRVAERLAPGPDLTAWLAAAPVAELDDRDLAAVAVSWRRVAAWAQARELAAVAQITSRAAARDEKIGTEADGRPVRVPASAAAEVALELTLSQYSACAWADLAVQLSWRLAATGAALANGVIDLQRARLIAEATSMLSDEKARAVEDKVLPGAGDLTTGMLRSVLRRAVIAADPDGAEERRKEAERQAKVVLYPDEDSTATLTGQRLPAIQAAAAMARITAMAWALKASGAGGGIDLLRAQVYIGLLLDTLPLIPPAEGAPPDDPPDSPRPDDPLPGGEHRDPSSGDLHDDPGASPVDGGAVDGGDVDDVPPPGDQDAPCDEDSGPDDGLLGNSGNSGNSGYCDDDDDWPARGPAPDWPGLPAVIPPAFTGPGAGRTNSRPTDSRPAAGLLDVTVPWQVLAGISSVPGFLGRIGPVTAPQALRLATVAAGDPDAVWRIIVTTSAGQALAVARVPRLRGRQTGSGMGQRSGAMRWPSAGMGPGAGIGPGAGMGPGAGIGLVGRVTLTIPEDLLTHPPPSWPGPGAGPDPPGGILARAIAVAAAAADRARAAMTADAAVGGCAHSAASLAYRPPPRLMEYIAARDLTCRFLRCRQPAWRGDLDHTIPFDDGGLTCRCNLGGLCRTHHILKHHPDWNLRQVAPGVFTWTTPAGRTYTTTPDTHAA
jgi:Domain of unknown function (DUF222)